MSFAAEDVCFVLVGEQQKYIGWASVVCLQWMLISMPIAFLGALGALGGSLFAEADHPAVRQGQIDATISRDEAVKHRRSP